MMNQEKPEGNTSQSNYYAIASMDDMASQVQVSQTICSFIQMLMHLNDAKCANSLHYQAWARIFVMTLLHHFMCVLFL
ncbi:hypothetical protein [Acinetobacter gerneri]|uniref:hypothetical protein n=1 Tax=Acinetobacter gerneri TaxID=202952 RepID=UPI0032129113